MCGIFGEIGEGGEAPLSLLAHRGPDERGVWRGRGVVFGHCRLAIVDLKGGKQPWVEEDKALTYNGEIYNFRVLRKQLEREGETFISRSDTEVLFKLLKRYGEKALPLLDGMFAFGFWDGRKLLLARDRFGVKPIYWTTGRGIFAFSSEIKPLLSLSWVSKAIDTEVLKFHLTFLWSPHPMTAFKKIRKLPPGHLLIWDGKEVKVRPFYHPMQDVREHSPSPEELRKALRHSIESQTMADVEVGLFLSGGLDSATVAALSPFPMRAFTLRFRGEDMREEIFSPEEYYAHVVAKRFNHELIPVEVRFNEETFYKVVSHLEEPVGDGAAISNYLLSEGARRLGIKVVLAGTGGDELWGGYPRYRALLLAKQFPFLKFLPSLPFSRGKMGRLARDVDKFKRAASLPFPLRYLHWLSYLDVFPETYNFLLRRFPKMEDELKAAMLFDIIHFLPEHNLLYTDKTSMAHGLEVRVPLLSNELLRLSLATPSSQKVNLREGKIILKRAMRTHLPDVILKRKKAGFGAPIKGWLKGPLRPLLSSLKSDPLLRELLPKEVITGILEESMEGRGFTYLQAFQMLTLATWRRVFFL
ncbi:MAG: asparagine synthase (glutamine-hydrolyzing) [Thermotogae bacterium]|nr:asparagine synthase (glutamine-hydrolyzing) [Thermotogota bacterium]